MTAAGRRARGRSRLAALVVLVMGVWLLPSARSALGAPAASDEGMVRVAMRGQDIGSLDPALAYDDASWSLLGATCARLMSSPLEPEVAARRPTVSRDGKTYTFTLR